MEAGGESAKEYLMSVMMLEVCSLVADVVIVRNRPAEFRKADGILQLLQPGQRYVELHMKTPDKS